MDNSTAAQVIRNLAIQYKGMVEVAEALDKLGSLENIEAEINKRIATARSEESNASIALTKAKGALYDAEDGAKMIVSFAKDRAGELEHQAQETASALLAEGEKKAEATRAQRAAELEAMHVAASARLAEVERKVALKNAELAKVSADHMTLEAELRSMREQINATKETMRQFVKA